MKLIYHDTITNLKYDIYVSEDRSTYANGYPLIFRIFKNCKFEKVTSGILSKGDFPAVDINLFNEMFAELGLPSDFREIGIYLTSMGKWGRSNQYIYRDKKGADRNITNEQRDRCRELFGKYNRSLPDVGFIRIDNFLDITTYPTGTELNSNDVDEKMISVHPDDYVSFPLNREIMRGYIKNFAESGISIICDDNKRRIIKYNKVKWCPESEPDTTYEDTIDPTINQNMKDALENVIILTVPYALGTFIDRDKSFELDSIDCPNCNSCKIRIDPTHYWTSKSVNECENCGQTILLVKKDQENNTVTINLGNEPSSNTFCASEAKCCSNCGTFNFEYGRQGKRTTGYCLFTKQCVQPHNVCPRWIPSNTDTYDNFMKNNSTNLSLGNVDKGGWGAVKHKDSDLDYTTEKHKEQKKILEKCKIDYNKAYRNFLSNMV